jgi:hypothetical protein
LAPRNAQTLSANYFFFLSGFCVRADPADVFAVLLEALLRKVLDAATAALEDVTFLGASACERADPAADLADLLESLLRKTFEAAVAARLLVTSRLLILLHLDLMF